MIIRTIWRFLQIGGSFVQLSLDEELYFLGSTLGWLILRNSHSPRLLTNHDRPVVGWWGLTTVFFAVAWDGLLGCSAVYLVFHRGLLRSPTITQHLWYTYCIPEHPSINIDADSKPALHQPKWTSNPFKGTRQIPLKENFKHRRGLNNYQYNCVVYLRYVNGSTMFAIPSPI